jgi:hypothetical protein
MQQRVHDADWSIGMALAWITCRSEEAVIHIKLGKSAFNQVATGDLVTALRSGKLVAHGIFEGERIGYRATVTSIGRYT